MSTAQLPPVALRLWSAGDLALEARLMSDPRMTTYLGGPESPEQIRSRHERFLRMNEAGPGRMFVILVGPERIAGGGVGYWETEWRGRLVWETGWSVLPEFQGQGIATRATAAMVTHVRAAGTHQYLHAFPSVENGPSNAICRKLGFTLLEAADFEYPPGTMMRCNDWCLDLFAGTAAAQPA